MTRSPQSNRRPGSPRKDCATRGLIASLALAGLLATVGAAWGQSPPPGPGQGSGNANYQGLWWNQSESGWGINFAHQGDVIFATWFTYDTNGKPWWLVATLPKSANNAYAGSVATVTGPPLGAVPFQPAPQESVVGTMTVTFTDPVHASLAYTVNGVTQTKAITPQEFGPRPTCTWGAQSNLALATNYTDLWWNPSESGWGINFSHQGDIVFATWFVYDSQGQPLWLTTTLRKGAGNVFSGSVSTHTGPAFNASPWNTGATVESTVGTATVSFADGNSAAFAYTVGGVSQTKSITRQVFVSPGTVCTSSGGAQFTMAQTISDEAQRTTIAFAGLGMMTGNLAAQSFFPPGKVADYTGFQYLRDNDPDGMGHNTSFLTRVAANVIYLLSDAQFAQLKTLATAQSSQIDQYGYQRYPLMQAFRRVLDGSIPTGSQGLNLDAVTRASRALYLIDGQISYDRAVLYSAIIGSLSATQKAYLDAMKGKGWNSWPNVTEAQIQERMRGLPQGTGVAVMTYASDLFSWYAGSVEADVYFCPERHGTYYGSFYIKDAPAVGHEGYSINEQLTATAGAALSDSAKGYVTATQAATMSALVEAQRGNLYADSAANIVQLRTEIATLLRSLLLPGTSASAVKTRVLELSGIYGELDGENNHAYVTTFAAIWKTMTDAQKTKLLALRKSILSGTYADGTPYDYTTAATPYLYSAPITDSSVLAPYIANADALFFAP